MKSFKIKAYGQTWKVRVLKKHPLLKNNFGEFNVGTNSIFIDATATEEQQRTTLMHEMIHLIAFCTQLSLKERDVMCLESGLYQIIHDNKLRF